MSKSKRLSDKARREKGRKVKEKRQDRREQLDRKMRDEFRTLRFWRV